MGFKLEMFYTEIHRKIIPCFIKYFEQCIYFPTVGRHLNHVKELGTYVALEYVCYVSNTENN